MAQQVLSDLDLNGVARIINALNPANAQDVATKSYVDTAVASAGGIPAGAVMSFAMSAAPSGWLAANGTAVLISSYSALATAIYCGDANNASAAWGYKATTSVNPSSNRSTAGTYIVLPDLRGEFVRGFDNGRGKDSGRTLYSTQVDDLKSHNHTASTGSSGSHGHSASASNSGTHTHSETTGSVTTNTNTTATGNSARVVTFSNVASTTGAGGDHTHTISIGAGGDHTHTVSVTNTGGTETRPSNLAMLYCIKT